MANAFTEDMDLQEKNIEPRNYLVQAATVVLMMALLIYGSLLIRHTRMSASEALAAYINDVVISSRTGLGPAQDARLARAIVDESRAHNLDPLFVLAIIKTESEFNNWSRSSKGALGLMQILPSTGREIAGRLSLDWQGEATLFDPNMNVKMGVYYFNSLNSRYDKDVKLSLAAYNAGPGRINASLSAGNEVSDVFSDRVMEHYKDLKQGSQIH